MRRCARALLVALAALVVGAGVGAAGVLLASRSSGEAIAFVRSRCEQPGASGFLLHNDGEEHAGPCRYALAVMDSAGTREVTVVEGMHDVRGVRFTSDGTRLVVAAALEPGRSGRRAASSRPIHAFEPQRGTDTLLVLPVDSVRGATPLASVVDLEAGRTVDSIPMPSPRVVVVAWSPGRRRLVAATPEMLDVVDRHGTATDSVAGAWKAHLRRTRRCVRRASHRS